MEQGTRIVSDALNYFATVTPDGILRRTVMTVKLDPSKGHYYLGRAIDNRPPPKIITAQGFVYLNSLAPIAFIPQPTLFNSDGREVGNPCKDLALRTVTVRRFAVGRSWDGQLRAYDLTLTYDLNAYFAADVLGKFNLCSSRDKQMTPPEWGTIVNERAAEKLLDKQDTWSYVKVAPGICLAFDCTHPVVRALYRENAEREKFPDRQAIALCNRNILKLHFGFTSVPDDDTVKICCWHSSSLNFETLEKSVVTRNGIVTIDGQQIDVRVEHSTATREDLDSLAGDEEEPSAEQVKPDPQKTAKAEFPEDWLKILGSSIRAIGGRPVADKLFAEELGKRKMTLASLVECKDVELLKMLNEMAMKHKREVADGKS